MLEVDNGDQARICCGYGGGRVAVDPVRAGSAANISERTLRGNEGPGAN